MPSYFPPKNAVEYIFYVGLVSQADTKVLQVNPTLAAGDAKVSIDGGAFNNITAIPVVTPAGGRSVKVTLSIAEMTGDNITVIFSDAAGAEWCDQIISLQTAARHLDDLTFPTVSGRSLDVTTTGEAGIDWANIGAPTTAVSLTGTNINNVLGTLTTTERAAIADALLNRNLATGLDSGSPSVRTVRQALRFLRNKWTVAATTLTVYKEDDTTPSWDSTVTTNSGAIPITGSDPA